MTVVPSALVAVGLRKSYAGVDALVDGHLRVEHGSIHAIVGENGAGKSTLMKGLVGSVQLDAGKIEVSGARVRLGSSRDARRAGIGIVYQELSLFPDLSVLDNLGVGNFETRAGFIRRSGMRTRADEVLRSMGLAVDLDLPVAALDIGERQMIEICRVLLGEPRVLILDEPTSALREDEVARLFGAVRKLSAEGVAVVYVSHRLDEVFDLSDKITVMRSGSTVTTLETSSTGPQEVITAMLGRKLDHLYAIARTPSVGDGDVDMEVVGLKSGPLRSISFKARAGEIIGFAGIQGSGADSVLPALFGVVRSTSERSRYPDGLGIPGSTFDAVHRGLCLVPGERRRYGLMMSKSIAENISHVVLGSGLSKLHWVSQRAMTDLAEDRMLELGIKSSSVGQLVDYLSGGNQQKVVVGKWLSAGPKLILLDDPTRGIDVGAKAELFELIAGLADAGSLVLLRSTEVAELAGLCDRVVVVHNGHGVGEITKDELTTGTLTQAVTTGTHHSWPNQPAHRRNGVHGASV